MPTCPVCQTNLETTRHHEGLYYLCSICAGRALTIPHLRRVAGDRFATKALRLLMPGGRRCERRCPFCGKAMAGAAMPEPPMEFEGCLSCNVVWMDAPMFESLSTGTIETTTSLAMQATEIYAAIKCLPKAARTRRTPKGPPFHHQTGGLRAQAAPSYYRYIILENALAGM